MNWILILLMAFTGCEVTVKPVGKKKVYVRQRHPSTHKVASKPKPKPALVREGPKLGTKTVDTEWMKEYLNLEGRYGRIPEDDEIRVNDGGFVIPDTVGARYQELKKRQIEEKDE